GRVTLGEDLDLVAVDDDRRVTRSDVARVRAVGLVALVQERVHREVDEVVDGDHLDVRCALDERLERLPTDPTEAVDADAGGHGARPPGRDARRSSEPRHGTWTSDGADRTGVHGGVRGSPGSNV